MKYSQHAQTIINQWQQDYQQLHDALNAEQLALEKRDFDELEKSTREKDLLVKQINAHALPPLIDKNGISIQSLVEFKQYCIGNSQLAETWANLMTLVEQCRFKNEVNARLIDLLNQSSKRTFNLIKGFDPDNNIYNATGNRTAVKYYGDPLSA